MDIANTLLPTSKSDTGKVERLLKLDRKDIAPHFADLLTWVQDINWPVASPIAEYFATGGEDTVIHVREILGGTDRGWQYNVIVYIVDHWPNALLASIREDLERLVSISICDGDEVDIAALGVLAKHRLSPPDFLRRWVEFKLMGARNIVKEIEEIEKIVVSGAGDAAG
jgi:Domain of unknown function (DUF5071)